MPGPVAYVTDLEGQWERWLGFVERSPLVAMEGERMVLAEGASFVFGGDAIDRGPHGRRIVRTLLDAKERYGERVVLLAGNRDVNKLRLPREFGGHPRERAPAEARASRPAMLRWTYAVTMNAPDAFAFRADELAREGLPHDDEAVVDSALDELAPDGLLTRYLASCVLIHRHDGSLFVHGGLGEESLGHVPGMPRVDDLDAFVDGLNRFYRDRIAAFVGRSPGDLAAPRWEDLIAYQAPAPGERINRASVVYGRLSDDDNNPYLPAREVVRRLVDQGVSRLVLGHTPSGDLPALLRAPGFELIVADNSRCRVASGSSVTIEGERVHVRGACGLDDGSTIEADFTTTLGEGSAIGSRSRDRLVKALADDRAVLYRGLPGYRIEQIAVERGEVERDALETPWPRR